MTQKQKLELENALAKLVRAEHEIKEIKVIIIKTLNEAENGR